MSKPWDISLSRRSAQRSGRRYLIVTEDEKSALDYLKEFKVPIRYAEIVPEGGAGNTIRVVERALELREQAIYSKNPFIHTWCVIDRDEHPEDRYRRAFEHAKAFDDVTVIWANECFELWYLLHFCYRDTGIGRDDIFAEISKTNRLNRSYKKADKEIFAILEKLRPIAHRHAERLLKSNPLPLDNPSTNIHRLVEKLVALQQAAAENS
jgi:hypothetical protein